MLYDAPRGASPSAVMTQSTTILVDTALERDDAAAAATGLYLRLVGEGTIAPQAIQGGSDTRFRVLDPQWSEVFGIEALALHASGHRWRPDPQGAHLIEGGLENGIFCRYDGSFSIRCPNCANRLAPGDEGSNALEEALAVWCDSPDSAYVACPACAAWSPLTEWASPAHDFAVGHFAITLYGAHVRDLLRSGDHAATALRHRLGDLASDYTVVFA